MGADAYHQTRLAYDPRRTVLWKELTRYLQRWIAPEATVLDFGAGYCDFINHVQAMRRLAFDVWPGVRDHAAPGVECIVGGRDSLAVLRGPIDVVFASNVFEHLTVDELVDYFDVFLRVMGSKGRIIALQPNFRYAYRRYFDDYTHKSIWTETSLSDFMAAHGFRPIYVRGDFLPLTVKSRLPVHPLLIRAYLHSPLRPFPGQMLVVAERRGEV